MARIIIADDDPSYLGVFCEGLELYGHSIVGVQNGEEVLGKIANEPFDLVFLDVMMQGQGAITLLHEVRKINEDVPIIVITGRADLMGSPLFTEGMREAAAKVSKSMSLSEINALVEQVLSK